MNSYGLYFVAGEKAVFITTDTVFSPDKLGQYMEQADLVFHDCETFSEASGVHARYDDLLTLPESIRSKTWLYHFDNSEIYDAVEDGFLGFVKRGQVFDLAD